MIFVWEFKLYSRCNVHFQINTLEKGKNPDYTLSYGLNSIFVCVCFFSARIALAFNNSWRFICEIQNNSRKNYLTIWTLTYNFFFFPRAVIRNTFISCSWLFFFLSFYFWKPWMLVDIRLVNIYIYVCVCSQSKRVELQYGYCINFWTNSLGKGEKYPYSPNCKLNSISCFTKMVLALNNARRLTCH